MTDIKKLHIRRYGKFEDVTFDFKPGLNVVYGPNEAGKSTLQKFSFQMLTGFPSRRSKSEITYYPDGADPSGVAVLGNEGRECTVDRVWRDAKVEGADLEGMLHGADDNLMNNVFIISHQDIQEFDTLGGNAQKDKVFSAGVVGAGTSARQVMADLAAQAEKLGGASKRKSEILKLVKKLSDLETDLREAREKMRAYPELVSNVRGLHERGGELKAQRDSLLSEVARLKKLADLQPVFNEASALKEQLGSARVPEVREAHVTSANGLAVRATELQDALAELTAERETACAQRDQLQLQDALWERRDEIRLREKEVTGIRAKRAQLAEIEDDIRSAEEELRKARRRLGQMDMEAALAITIDEVLLGERGQFQRELAEGEKTVQDFSTEVRRATAEVTKAKQRLEGLPEVVNAVEADLEADVDRLVELRSRRSKLAAEAIERPPQTPSWVISAAWVVALFCGVFSIAGLVLDSPFGAAILAVLAVISFFGGFFLRNRLKREVAQEESRRSQVFSRLEEMDAEGASLADELQVGWPVSTEELGSLRRRAREVFRRSVADSTAASARAGAEENLLAAKAAVTAAAGELENAQDALQETEERWSIWLHEQGLPQTSPEIARELLEAAERAQETNRQLTRMGGNARSLQLELNEWEGEIEALSTGVGLASTDSEPEQQVEVLVRWLEEESTRRATFNDLEKAVGAAQKQIDEKEALLRDVEADLSELLGQFDAVDITELEQMKDQFDEVSQNRQELKERELSISRSLGNGPSAAEIRALLRDGEVERWKRERDEREGRLPAVDAELEEVIEERTTVQNAIDDLEESTAIPKLQLEFESLRTRLIDAVREWQELEAAHRLIGLALKKYREERQPDVLRDAQRFFERATAGRYNKITLDDESDEVVVHESETGIYRDLEHLSSGTEDPLYLSVRMGLAAEFGRNRGPLPMLMDDVLVNMGKERRRAMIRAIADFAGDQQVIFFTCHDHMLAEFMELAEPNVISLEGDLEEVVEEVA